MRGIVYIPQIYLAILVSVFLPCSSQQQGRPYFNGQQNFNAQNARNNDLMRQNIQQQYRPQGNPALHQNLNPQRGHYAQNAANGQNPGNVQLPQNQFQADGQMFKRVGDQVHRLSNNPAGQNVQYFNQGQINMNNNPAVVKARDTANERERQRLSPVTVQTGIRADNLANSAKDNNANKPQLNIQGSNYKKETETHQLINNDKPKNDDKNVFVFNKNKFDSDKVGQLNGFAGVHNNNNINNNKESFNNKANVVTSHPVKQSFNSNADVVQPNKLVDTNNNIDNVAANDKGVIDVHNLPVDLKHKFSDTDNMNRPVDINDPNKLNAAYKELAEKPKLPDHVNVIEGEVEKDKPPSEDFDDEEDEDEAEDPVAVRRSDTEIENNNNNNKDSAVFEVPRNLGAAADNPNRQVIHDNMNGQQYDRGQQTGYRPQMNGGQQVFAGDQMNNNIPPRAGGQQINFDGQESEKEGSLKVIWDWSDFAVNFEQYIAPEQKIRRAPRASTGEPWPYPQYYVAKQDVVYRIDKNVFHFKLSKVKCDIIEKAVERYKSYILEDSVEDMYDNFQHAQSTAYEDPLLKYETPTYLEAPYHAFISVKIRKPCPKLPGEKMDETYDLFVKRTGIFLWANEVWGALRGLETFSQLVFKGPDSQLYVKDTVVNDYPRFSHRGILVDSSRHFIFKETIFDILEGMAQNKMNVMHWHIVDDQSFPYQSKAYPDLSEKGAFHPSFVYTPEDIIEVIEFARLRGIRVMPEFDTPGHTYSWGLSRPDLLTQCFQGDRPVDGYLGPLDPSKNETFRFLKNFFKDVLHSFKDQYLHLGGDEVPMTCWSSNPEVLKLLAKLEGRPEPDSHKADPYYYSYDIRKVLEFYVQRLMTDVKQVGTKRTNSVRLVFWQEIMNNDVQLPNDTIIQVWQGGMEEVQRAISLGLNVIYSTCWYLDLIEYGTKWSKYYHCDPADSMYGYSIDETKVLGGEACLWAEYIDNENLMSTLWPRASATAERLWSHKDVRDIDSAATRLQEHRCRMLSRGLAVGQISGPDYCLRRGKRHHSVNNTQSVNCTLAQCASFAEKGRVEIEKIKVEFQQKGGPISDCSQKLNANDKGYMGTVENLQTEINRYMSRSRTVLQAGGNLSLILLVVIIVGVALTLKFTKKKIVQVRMCKNKTILLTFITLILVYFMCYTSIWMQALQFKGSFEKRISSNIDDRNS